MFSSNESPVSSQRSLGQKYKRPKTAPESSERWPRYPAFDHKDPFAPLSVLRTRTVSTFAAENSSPYLSDSDRDMSSPESTYSQPNILPGGKTHTRGTPYPAAAMRPLTPDSSSSVQSSIDSSLPELHLQPSHSRVPVYGDIPCSQSNDIEFPCTDGDDTLSRDAVYHLDSDSGMLVDAHPQDVAQHDITFRSCSQESLTIEWHNRSGSSHFRPLPEIPTQSSLERHERVPAIPNQSMASTLQTCASPVLDHQNDERAADLPLMITQPPSHRPETRQLMPNLFDNRRRSFSLVPLRRRTDSSEVPITDSKPDSSVDVMVPWPALVPLSERKRKDPKRPQTAPDRAYSDSDSPRERALRSSSRRPQTAPSYTCSALDEYALATPAQLEEASKLCVVAESGVRVPFGNLWLGQKTVVCFIRHFWCPLCQDYMYSISKTVDPNHLRAKGINLVIISNGSHNMIKSYRQIFRTPFAVYTDPTHRLYAALGMASRSVEHDPAASRGSYVRHGSMAGLAMVVANAMKVRMPVWEKGGDTSQLGGEFVLGPGLRCSFAHRMRTPRGHLPIAKVLSAAGIDITTRPESARISMTMSSDEEFRWMQERKNSLARMRAKRDLRRKGVAVCGRDAPCMINTSNLPVDKGKDDLILFRFGRKASPIQEESPTVEATLMSGVLGA